MALTNAEKQRRYRQREAAKLHALRHQVRQAQPATVGHLLELLIDQLATRPAPERAKALRYLSRRLGIVEAEQAAARAGE